MKIPIVSFFVALAAFPGFVSPVGENPAEKSSFPQAPTGSKKPYTQVASLQELMSSSSSSPVAPAPTGSKKPQTQVASFTDLMKSSSSGPAPVVPAKNPIQETAPMKHTINGPAVLGSSIQSAPAGPAVLGSSIQNPPGDLVVLESSLLNAPGAPVVPGQNPVQDTPSKKRKMTKPASSPCTDLESPQYHKGLYFIDSNKRPEKLPFSAHFFALNGTNCGWFSGLNVNALLNEQGHTVIQDEKNPVIIAEVKPEWLKSYNIPGPSKDIMSDMTRVQTMISDMKRIKNEHIIGQTMHKRDPSQASSSKNTPNVLEIPAVRPTMPVLDTDKFWKGLFYLDTEGKPQKLPKTTQLYRLGTTNFGWLTPYDIFALRDYKGRVAIQDARYLHHVVYVNPAWLKTYGIPGPIKDLKFDTETTKKIISEAEALKEHHRDNLLKKKVSSSKAFSERFQQNY